MPETAQPGQAATWAYVLVLVLVLGLGFWACTPALSFADPAFESAVRSAVGVEGGRLLPHHVEGLEEMDAAGREIWSVAGVGQLTALRSLNVAHNELTDLSPLVAAQLPTLQELDITHNPLDFSAGSEALEHVRQLQARGWQVRWLTGTFRHIFNEGQLFMFTSAMETADGGYLAGGPDANSFSDAARLIRTDSEGMTLWRRSLDGDRAAIHAVAAAHGGGYILAGHQDFSLLVQTRDGEGDVVWTRTFDSEDAGGHPLGSGADVGYALAATGDGGYVIAGGMDSPAGDAVVHYYVWVIKLDGDGNSEWSRRFGDDESLEWAHDVRQTRDGGFIVVGQRIGAQSDGFALKLDAGGEEEWHVILGGEHHDSLAAVVEVADGYLLAGGTQSFSGSIPHNQGWLLKLAPDGSDVWSRAFPGPGGSGAFAALTVTADGELVLAGTSPVGEASQAWLVRADSDGTEREAHRFGDGQAWEGFTDVLQTGDGGLLAAGYTARVLDDGGWIVGQRGVMIKTDAMGRLSD